MFACAFLGAMIRVGNVKGKNYYTNYTINKIKFKKSSPQWTKTRNIVLIRADNDQLMGINYSL